MQPKTKINKTKQKNKKLHYVYKRDSILILWVRNCKPQLENQIQIQKYQKMILKIVQEARVRVGRVGLLALHPADTASISCSLYAFPSSPERISEWRARRKP